MFSKGRALSPSSMGRKLEERERARSEKKPSAPKPSPLRRPPPHLRRASSLRPPSRSVQSHRGGPSQSPFSHATHSSYSTSSPAPGQVYTPIIRRRTSPSTVEGGQEHGSPEAPRPTLSPPRAERHDPATPDRKRQRTSADGDSDVASLVRMGRSRSAQSVADRPGRREGASGHVTSHAQHAPRGVIRPSIEHTRRGQPTSKARSYTTASPGEVGIPPASEGTEDITCDFCASELRDKEYHTCRDCPFRLCLVCIVNAEVFYPDHSDAHVCKTIEPGQPAGSGPGPSRSGDVQPLRHGQPCCEVCDEVLHGLRYDCEQCHVSLCGDDRDLHMPDHVLRPRYGGDTAEERHEPEMDSIFDQGQDAASDQDSAPGETRAGEDDQEGESEGDSAVDYPSERDSMINPSDRDTWDVTSNNSSIRPRGARPRPQRFTLSLPIDSSVSLTEWARAILQQAPQRTRVPRGRGGHRLWVWTPRDKQRLRRMKERGLSDQEAADALGRTAGAVAQQWRKQRLGGP